MATIFNNRFYSVVIKFQAHTIMYFIVCEGYMVFVNSIPFLNSEFFWPCAYTEKTGRRVEVMTMTSAKLSISFLV